MILHKTLHGKVGTIPETLQRNKLETLNPKPSTPNPKILNCKAGLGFRVRESFAAFLAHSLASRSPKQLRF